MASRVPMPAGLEIASCTAMFLGDLGLDFQRQLEQVGTLTGIVWVDICCYELDRYRQNGNKGNIY